MALAPSIAVIALVLAGLAALVAAASLRRARRSDARLAALQQDRRRLLETVEGLSSGAVTQGERIARLEQELQRLKERLSMLGSRESGGEAFEQAIRMARAGKPSEEIASTCGLSRVEADLVVLIHQEGGRHGQSLRDSY